MSIWETLDKRPTKECCFVYVSKSLKQPKCYQYKIKNCDTDTVCCTAVKKYIYNSMIQDSSYYTVFKTASCQLIDMVQNNLHQQFFPKN